VQRSRDLAVKISPLLVDLPGMSIPFGPGSVSAVSSESLDDSWLTWAATADDADELTLAGSLLESAPSDRHTTDVGVAHARLLLLQGQPGAALAELARLGLTEVPVEGPRSWSELVLVAARAATGDPVSFQRLIEAASRTAGEPQAWRVAYLVAAAAEQTGQSDIAHQAWRALAVTHGIVTPLTVSRLAAGEVVRRDREDHEAVTAVVLTQARNLSQLIPGPADDPGPVLAAVADLRARGDEAGARLLLRAVTRLNPPNAAITAALQSGAPIKGQNLHRAKVVGASLLALALVPAGLVGVLIVWGVARLWARYVRLPGFSLTDSVAWRAIGTLPPQATSVDGAKASDRSAYGWYGVVGVIGVFAWIPIGYSASAFGADALGGGSGLEAILYLLGLIGLPAFLILVTRVIWRRVLGARWRRRLASTERRRLAAAGQCRCWQTRGLTGELAAAYGTAHLRPVVDGAAVEVLHQRLGMRASVARCPVTGTLWLGGELGRGGTAVQLRGNVPTDLAPAAEAARGFYL
jgi:hypothetical protein